MNSLLLWGSEKREIDCFSAGRSMRRELRMERLRESFAKEEKLLSFDWDLGNSS